jgi:hypothetical protein
MELERASRGDRPAVSASSHRVVMMNMAPSTPSATISSPTSNFTTTSLDTTIPTSTITTLQERDHIQDIAMKRQAITFEESKMRDSLFLSENELRKRLGMSSPDATNTTTTTTNNKISQIEIDKALELGRKNRDSMLDELLQLTGDLKEIQQQANRNLHHDMGRVDAVNEIVSKNIDHARNEIGRMQVLIASTSGSCRKTCALVTFVLGLWIAMYIFMKIVPSPRVVRN